jgi:glycine oxidase
VETAEVIVGGGGIIGLSVALELARSGFGVRVVEKNRFMGEASWAAAGMLSGRDAHLLPELAELAELSLSLYPGYLGAIEELSGHAIPLRTREALVACSEQDANVSAEEAQGRIPGISVGSRWFCLKEEASLDPRDLCAALPLAAKAAGVVLQEQTEILAVRASAGSVEVTTSSETLNAGSFVNCCGAWAGKVHQEGLEPRLAGDVEPWKGQIFAVRLDSPVDLACVLRSPEVYLVPRGAGLIVIGATVERVGFDRQVDSGTVERLRALAAELWPPIASGRVVEVWSGLRPGTRDELPLIGEAGGPHCWIATGHFRNGILLAPATALVMRQLLQGIPPEVPLAAFFPGRLTSDNIQSAAL